MILPEKIKLSPFSHTFSNNNVVAVYDSLSHNVFYGDRELVSFLERIKAQKKIDPKDLKNYMTTEFWFLRNLTQMKF